MKTTALALSFLFLLKGVGGCTEILTDIWATESGTSSFAFSVTVPASGFIQFVINKEDSASLLQFSYNGGSLIGGSVSKAADVDITGDLTIGNASFTLSNIDRSENGTYRLRNPLTSEALQCVTLRVKGIVTVILNDPGSVEAGGDITFTCTTSTTTVPASTDYIYTWRVDNKIVTASSRYSFSSDKFTISDTSVDRENGKDVTCSAAEPIGSPSAESNAVTIYVTGTTTAPKASSTAFTTGRTATALSTPPLNCSLSTKTMIPNASITTATATRSTSASDSTKGPTDTTATTSTAPTTLFRNATPASPATTPAPSALSTTGKVTRSANSDKGLVVMIVVVSVIGGIFVIAIIFMVFLMMHWKHCFGSAKQDHHHIYRHDINRTHHKRNRLRLTNERTDYNSSQLDHVLKGYHLYKGGVKNPVFEEVHENFCPPFENYRETTDMFLGHTPPEYHYANNWRVIEYI